MYDKHSAGYVYIMYIQTYRTYIASFNFHIDLVINILPVRGLNFKISCLRSHG